MKSKLIKKKIDGFKKSTIEFDNHKDLTRGSYIIKLWVASDFKETRLEHHLKQYLLGLKTEYKIDYFIVDCQGPFDRSSDYYYLKIDIAIKSELANAVEDVFDLVMLHVEDKIGESMAPDYTPKQYLKKVKPPVG